MIKRFVAVLHIFLVVNIGFMFSEADDLMPNQSTQIDLKITIVYENTGYMPDLTVGWGFSALIEYNGHTLLFDTGADGESLLNNLAALNIDPQAIEAVVLSHNHGDHTGGLQALLSTGIHPVVYLTPSFPASFKRQVAGVTTVVETTPDQIISEGIFTTGEIGGSTPEQAIAIETDQGVVVLTGCAHPGIVPIIEHVKATSGKPLYLVLGGFHLGSKTPAEIESIVQAFRRLGLEYVGPCHCTGEQAIAAFAKEYGGDYIQIGTGKVIEISSTDESPPDD